MKILNLIWVLLPQIKNKPIDIQPIATYQVGERPLSINDWGNYISKEYDKMLKLH